MKKEILRNPINPERSKEDLNKDDFTEIHSIVDNLLIAIEQMKKERVKFKKNKVPKKWKKTKPKKQTLEDLGIRDLPFTF